MMKLKKIKIGSKTVEAMLFKLAAKNLIVLKGSGGYVMCGYLNMRAAERFRDVAVKITGISTIEEALDTTVASCTSHARKAGIHKGQKIRDVLKIIA